MASYQDAKQRVKKVEMEIKEENKICVQMAAIYNPHEYNMSWAFLRTTFHHLRFLRLKMHLLVPNL